MKPINWILLFILMIGAALRFYGFPHIPFTYDELSSWGRTGYTSFSELIDKGVRGDGHPAFIQVFLNYWRKIFGDSEAAFKFPFLLMGFSCIYLTFLIGKLWFSETVAIIGASFIAVLQYTVMYSQIARPYISGLFFSLMMVWCWTRYVFPVDGSRKKKFLAGFVLFAVLCCYNHYFSLLVAAIVGISGFFYIPRKSLAEYAVAQVSVIVLFLPHIGVTRDQFSIGGVGGWLPKPDENFFWNYPDYVFHFSWWVKGLVMVLVAASFFYLDEKGKSKNKFRLLATVWFLMPLLVGYFYSRLRNPVLQYSVLIFSFPFLLLCLFSFFGNMKWLHQLIAVGFILVIGSYTLIVNRRHYEIFYNQPVEEMMKRSVEFIKQHPKEKVSVIINEPKKYMGYYLSKWKFAMPQLRSWQDLDFQSYIETRKFFDTLDADYVLCGNVPYDHLELIKSFFPKPIGTDKGFTYEFFSLARPRVPDKEIYDLAYFDTLNFSRPELFSNINKNFVREDSLTRALYYHQDTSQVFGPTFSAWLHDIMKQRDDILMVDVKVRNTIKNSKASLIISFDQEGQTVFWQEKPFSYFMDSLETSGDLVYAFRFRDFEFTHTNPLLKIFIWNRNHEAIDITSMKVEIQKGNPLIYSLIEPVSH